MPISNLFQSIYFGTLNTRLIIKKYNLIHEIQDKKKFNH